MKRALVVNCSVDRNPATGRDRFFYNLAVHKLADYLVAQGYDVTQAAGDPGIFSYGYDLVACSAIFSWHAQIAADVALRTKAAGSEVWVGGTAFSSKHLRARFRLETGDIEPVWKPDPRFDLQRAARKFVYSTRGCPGELLANGRHRPCDGCPVPIIEGSRYGLDREFIPAPNLLDNNLSGMPDEYQDFIVRRYQEFGTRLIDANSGFEPGHFTEKTRARWEPILAGAWRWGFDNLGEEPHVRRMGEILSDIEPRRKRVYSLCGNEPIASCYERARKVLELLDAEPHVQFMIPLSAWDRYDTSQWHADDQPRFDWTVRLGREFSRYWNARYWRQYPIWEHRPWVHEPPPFAFLKPTWSIAV